VHHLIPISALLWAACEMALRLRQRRHRGRTVTREWRSLVVIWMCAVLGALLAAQFARRMTGLAVPWLHSGAGILLALVIAWCGIALRLWAVATLGRFFRPIVHIQEGHQLVRTGPYRVLRHPAYTGMVLTLFGLTLPLAHRGHRGDRWVDSGRGAVSHQS
jgi:protein-S-isoprenylcysteine O-methyltransferase Ste14